MKRKEYLPFGKPNFSDEEIKAVTRVMKSGWIGMGKEVISFEQELSVSIKAPQVVTVDSCTSALFLSLLIHNVKDGDEVIAPSLAWCSAANAALYTGAKLVFCDIDPETLCVTSDLIQSKISSKTKAVIVVHFGGLTVDVERIRKDLPENIIIIEDAAHALGSRYSNGKPVGTSGNLTCFSFYANKNLSTGEGGAIALHNEGQADMLRALRQHGLPFNAYNRFVKSKSIFKTEIVDLGYKMNYIDLHAAIGRIQLKRQNEFYKIRLNIAQKYLDGLINHDPIIRFQKDIVEARHARHLFVIRLPLEQMKYSRDKLIHKMREKNIGASIHYEHLHTMPLYNKEKQPPLPNTEEVYKRILTLPISASMSLDDAEYVIKNLRENIL